MILKIRTILLVLPFVFGLNLAKGQNSDSFSLEQAIQYAMKHSYVLQNTSNEVEKAQKKVWETITTGLPQVSGSANYNAFLELPVMLVPGEYFGGEKGTYISIKSGQDFNSDFGLSVSQLIFDGSYIVGVSSSQIYLNLAKQSHEKTQIDIREAVTQAYYMALISNRNMVIMKENLENEENIYNETKILYENGFREEQDVEQIDLLLRNAKNAMLKAERELKIAKVVLKFAMGYEMNNNIVLTDQLERFIAPLVQKQNTINFNFKEHIDYQISATNLQVSEKLLKLQKAAYLPQLSGFYSYTKSAYGKDFNLWKSSTKWYPSSIVGLKLSMNIFSSGMKRAKVQQAKIDLESAQNQQRLTETTLEKEYLTAVANMENALESYQNNNANRDLAEKIKTKTKIKFDNGIVSSTELAQIETQYLNAYQALVASMLQLLQADINLKKAIGKL
ncbi:MAG: hypothetical protein CSA36_00790 [Draconibacterium sp.]|nr:MAG: hypothetical protein CSA36_00790 [Draconibacterium sp.]